MPGSAKLRWLLLTGLAFGSPAFGAAPGASSAVAAASGQGPQRPSRPRAAAEFGTVTAAADVQEVAAWAVRSRNTRGLPFVIIDKRGARVFVFARSGRLLGDAPVLLGLAVGDESVPGIGERRLATITPGERTTPAGRFVASLGHDLDQDILWIDYGMALSLHRVIVGRPGDRRGARLASRTPLDNRISYGCINVPAPFYDAIVSPAFNGTVGIVYILPETKPLREVFPISGRATGPTAPN